MPGPCLAPRATAGAVAAVTASALTPVDESMVKEILKTDRVGVTASGTVPSVVHSVTNET